jgi:Iap family predicted aminopeptidase
MSSSKYLLFIGFFIIQNLTFSQNFRISNSTDSIISEYLSQVSADSIESYITHLQNFGSRDAQYTPTTKPVARWILKKFVSFGFLNSAIDSFKCEISGDTLWQYNVIAMMTGKVNPSRVLIIGAHHDSYTGIPNNAPGADDNASGVAGVLETARILKKNNFQNPYTIKFITFAAEEYDMLGSRDYVNKAVSSGEDIQMMINFDMISFLLPDSVSGQWYISERKYQNAAWLIDLADYIRTNFTILAPYYKNGYYSDSDVFYQFGYPAVFLQEYYGPYASAAGHHPFIHTINDVVSNYDMNYCAEIIKVGLGMLIKAPDTLTYIAENSLNMNNINLYPNPCSSYIIVESSDYKNSLIEIYNINGQFLYGESMKEAETLIDLFHLPEGMYFVKIINPDRFYIKKIIKQ